MKNGIELITIERKEQIEKHGRSVKDDVILNNDRQLLSSAIILCHKDPAWAFENKIPNGWDPDIWDKMLNKPILERLAIAGALIAAEIDRINYIKSTSNGQDSY